MATAPQKKPFPWLKVFLVSSALFAVGKCSETFKGSNESEAWSMAKQFVSNRLKAPSTANFPRYESRFVFRLDSRRYQVSAWVEAENAFGSPLRKPFTCTIAHEKGYEWTLESLSLDD